MRVGWDGSRCNDANPSDIAPASQIDLNIQACTQAEAHQQPPFQSPRRIRAPDAMASVVQMGLLAHEARACCDQGARRVGPSNHWPKPNTGHVPEGDRMSKRVRIERVSPCVNI